MRHIRKHRFKKKYISKFRENVMRPEVYLYNKNTLEYVENFFVIARSTGRGTGTVPPLLHSYVVEEAGEGQFQLRAL